MTAPRKEENVSLRWKAGKHEALGDVMEFSLPNGKSEHDWHWRRGGRDIGVSIDVTDAGGRVYSVYEPYVLAYARMLEPPCAQDAEDEEGR
jgi:hypothetical protein